METETSLALGAVIAFVLLGTIIAIIPRRQKAEDILKRQREARVRRASRRPRKGPS